LLLVRGWQAWTAFAAVVASVPAPVIVWPTCGLTTRQEISNTAYPTATVAAAICLMVYELSRMAGLAARPEGLHSELALRAAVLREQERMTRGPAEGRRNLHPHEEQAWQPVKTP